MTRVLAVASGGGHWEQLMLLSGGLAAGSVRYVTTDPRLAAPARAAAPAVLPDCNLDRPLAALRCAAAAYRLLRIEMPDVVISTGAAPGLFCILWGRMLGARTMWIDSVANAEQLSLSGRLARRLAHRCLTQWQHLADGNRVHYAGSVL